VVCEAGNFASAKTIERHGGVLEEVQDIGLGTAWRYWIAL
jgi:predicted acetyltransferase